MNNIAFLDISAFLWDETHFNAHGEQYYPFVENFQKLLEEILHYRIPVWIRPQLVLEIMNNFPYQITDQNFYDFQLNTLDFLSKVKIHEYTPQVLGVPSSIPEQVKNHYTNNTKQELRYLLRELFILNDTAQKFVTFEVCYQGHDDLLLQDGHDLSLLTYFYDDKARQDWIISRFRRLFEHNKKHNKYNSSKYKYHGEVISGLSCYNDRLKDSTKAQQLLESAVLLRDHYYAHDGNKTYVKFVPTGDNVYHGFDVILNEHDERTLKKIFNKGNA